MAQMSKSADKVDASKNKMSKTKKKKSKDGVFDFVANLELFRRNGRFKKTNKELFFWYMFYLSE